MADTIEKKILIDIQTTAVKNLAEAQTAIRALREEIKQQSKDYANNSESIAQNQLKIKQLQGVVSEQTKIAMDANAQIEGNVGAYKKLSLQYAVAAQKAKDLAAGQNANSKETKQAIAEAFALSEKLKAVDKSVGQNQRSVGDYGKALDGLAGMFGSVGAQAQSALGKIKGSFESINVLVDDYKTALLEQKQAQEIAKASADALRIAEEKEALAKIAQQEASQALTIAEAELTTATATATATEVAQTAVENANTVALEANVVASTATAEAEVARAAATATATTATVASATAVGVLKTALIASGIGVFIVAIGAIATWFGVMLPTIEEFEQQMAKVGAITNATGKELKDLKQLAIDIAGSSKYSATEVAGLEEELGKLGYTSQQIIDASEGIVMASSATGESLEKTAEIVGSVTSAFGLNASESKRVADVMSQSFNATALGLDNFSESIKYVAPIAKQAGVSLEETTALLGLLANNGIKGSQAGTSLRQILSQLSGEGGTLQEKLAKLSKEGLNLAGAEDEVGRNAKTALLVLKDNAEVLPKLTTEFENSAGASKIAAEKMLDTISGKTTLLQSAWKSLILSLDSGDGAFSKGYKSFIDGLTDTIKNTKLLSMSQSELRKDTSKEITDKRLEGLDAQLRKQKDQVKYINEQIIAEKKQYQEKQKLVAEFRKSGNDYRAELLKDNINQSKDYVNALGNLRRAKQDETKLNLKNKEILDKNNSLQTEEEKEAIKKSIELQKKKTDERLKANERILSNQRKTFEEEGKFQIIDPTIVAYRLKQLETFTQQEKINVIARAKYEKKTKEELTAELQAVDAKLQSDKTALLQKAGQDTIDHNNRLAEIEKLHNAEILAGKKQTLEEQHQAEVLAIELTKINAKKEIDAKKEIGTIGEVEYQDEIAKIDQQAKTDLAISNAEFIKAENEKEYNAKKSNIDRELALSYTTADREYQLTLEKLELEKQAEIKKAKETGESIDLIEKEYADKEVKANSDKLKRQADEYIKYGESIANVFSAFSDLMKANENAELQKDTENNEAKKANLQERLDKGIIDKKTFDKEVANSEKELDSKKKKIEREQAIRARVLSAFSIIASTAQAVIGALSPLTGLGPVAGIPFAIAAGAVGAIQLATMLAAPLPKASKGTVLRGASHANGGIPIEAEGGEAIINKRSTSMFLPVLSAINEAGGGVPFVQTMADGGYVSRNSNQSGNSSAIADIVRATVSEMKIYTTIEDIRKEDKKYTNIEASANF